jgi:hypothetical protein
MNLPEKILQYINENPSVSSKQIATHFDTTTGYVKQVKSRLRKRGKMEKFDPMSRRKTHPALAAECEKVGLPTDNVSNYWYKGKHFSIHVNGKDVSLWDLKERLIEEMKGYSPKYPKLEYPKVKEGHLLVIDPADMHIGKLCSSFETGDEYNHKIATDRVNSGVAGILQKATGFPIDKVMLIIGNDMLHVDNAKSSTTKGTHQDTDLMWYDAFNIAFKLQVGVIEKLLTVAPTHVQYDPSNHDYITGFLLAQALAAWFRNNKNIVFNVSPAHRKYFTYFNNLIGSTHGDGAKESDLGMLMAHESSDWNKCKHRYFYTHHLHHKKSKDYMSVCVETLRSPSGTDSWHHRNGYQHSPKAIEGYIHHKDHGQIARLTHLF